MLGEDRFPGAPKALIELFAHSEFDVVRANNCLIKYYERISVTCAVCRVVPTCVAGSHQRLFVRLRQAGGSGI